MSEATFTFRVDASLKDEFSSAAKSRDRTGAQLLRDFMRDFVKQQQEAAEHDAWFRRQVQVGLDSAIGKPPLPVARLLHRRLHRRGAHRPVVSAERRRRQPGGVDEIALGIVGPRVAHGRGRFHLGAGDDDVVARDGEPLHLVALGGVSCPHRCGR